MTYLSFVTEPKVPTMATIAIEACDDSVGEKLAIALADLGAKVLLQGQQNKALEKLQRTIAERWGRATINSASMGRDATIGFEIDVRSAIQRIAGITTDDTETNIVLIDSSKAHEHAELQPMLSGLDPELKVHAITLNSNWTETGIDFSALARICALLASNAGRAMANQHIVLQKHELADDANGATYPEMTVCAPTIVPVS